LQLNIAHKTPSLDKTLGSALLLLATELNLGQNWQCSSSWISFVYNNNNLITQSLIRTYICVGIGSDNKINIWNAPKPLPTVSVRDERSNILSLFNQFCFTLMLIYRGFTCFAYEYALSLGARQRRNNLMSHDQTYLINQYTNFKEFKAIYCFSLYKVIIEHKNIKNHQDNGIWKWKENI